ncbi:hypothetical protein [Micromonospora sp. NPDC047527]|uniref:hypothetical protein n=1 Tax=unclassified Micromonospora TaxID=2617518 RepID=UPI0033DC3457
MFRAARPEDFAQVLHLYRQLNPDDPVLEDGSDAAAFQQILASPALHLFVLEVDGIVVATTYLNLIPNLTRSASPYAVIENVVVKVARIHARLLAAEGLHRAAESQGRLRRVAREPTDRRGRPTASAMRPIMSC